MKIKKMTADFGCLDGRTLELHDGLNVVYAPNESGKSTWCAFIRAMLYGVPTSQREKAGAKPEKLRYAPWSGAPMAGEMEIEHEGADISLIRSTKTAGAPMREFSAVYTGTAQPYPGLNGANAGEVLTGLSRPVFESSVFIGQSALPVAMGEELERRIDAIISTGEEDGVSYTAADAKLRAWQRKRKFNRSGRIPELDSEIEDKSALLDALGDSDKARGELEAQLARESARLDGQREQERQRGDLRRQEHLSRLESLRGSLAGTGEALASARREAAELEGRLNSGPFGGAEPEEAKRQLDGDIDMLSSLKSRVHSYATQFLPAFVGAALLLIALKLNLPKGVSIAAAVLAVLTIPLSMIFNGRRKEYRNYARAIVSRYGSDEPGELRALLAKYREDYVLYQEKSQAVEALELRAGELRRELGEAEARLLEGSPDAGRSGGLAETEARIADIRRRLDNLSGRFDAMGDPMVISTELAGLRELRRELEGQYKALDLAISVLAQANDEMQQRFSPMLSRRAGEIMSALTGGRYERLSFDRSMNAAARRMGDTVSHELGYLSAGTVDQLYLSLRLAICELALPQGCDCPLVLDDALVNFDDRRMEQALDVLSELARERQVILFTCHHRELDYIQSKNRTVS